MLCAHGWAGQTQFQFWWRILQSKIRNSAATKKEAAESEGGQKFLPSTPFLFARPSVRFGARSAQSFGVLLKECSNIVQKTPPSFTFSEIDERCYLGAKRLGMVFFRNFEGIFEIQKQSAVGNAEVPVRQHRENEVFRTNLFFFRPPAGGRKVEFIFL